MHTFFVTCTYKNTEVIKKRYLSSPWDRYLFFIDPYHFLRPGFLRGVMILFLVLEVQIRGFSQVTTSSLDGIVTDVKGEGLFGATVVAVHEPSGTRYGSITRDGGLFSINNVRVGGPYTVTVTYVGYADSKKNDIFLNLNEKLEINFTLSTEDIQLQDITVAAERTNESQRSGVSTNISAKSIQIIPNITRSQSDLTKLNPMAAEGGSFAGRNSQFNNYSLDGAIFNNPFGLDAATPGGQSDAQPISLDAIEQVSVSIAPYDVTQAGFTGAAVNLVTKSGTNQFKGTVFEYFRNSALYGKKVNNSEVPAGNLSQNQLGFSVGGPIIKNKIFFFANYEQSTANDYGSYWFANTGTGAGNESRVLASDLQKVSNLLKTNFGYETGAYEKYIHYTNSYKGILKFDFNISDKHKLSITGNVLQALKDKPAHPSALGRRGPDFQTLQFENSGYRINNNLYSGIIDLKSNFNNSFSNKLQIGYSAFIDYRDPKSTPFPVINISRDGIPYIVAGHEPFSIANKLNQFVFQLRDDFTYFVKKHTITVGFSFERFSFQNSFNLTGYGPRVFFPPIDIKNIEIDLSKDALGAEVASALATYEQNKTGNNGPFGGWALAETNVGQLAFYAQDEIAVSKQLHITIGIRMDQPLYFDTPEKAQENIERVGAYMPDIVYYYPDGRPTKLSTTKLPDQVPLISPRFGFNYDITGNKKMVLRGGTGLFTGRFPFVWLGNQVANPAFFFYCVTDPDFKFPQVWRSNLGYDIDILGWKSSIDVLYTKDLNAMMVRNYGLIKPTARLNTSFDNRPVYLAKDKGANTAYVFTNTDVGYSFNLSLQTERTFQFGKTNLYVKLGYNYLDAQDASSIPAEISGDAYDRNPANINNTNIPNLAPSLYGNRNRILGVLAVSLPLNFNISLFTEYIEGGRYSYTYSGDLNNDGSGLNDLLYVPTDAQIDGMNFSGDATAQTAQKGALKSFINQDEYLSSKKGSYTEKYGALSPWYNHWDLRIVKNFVIKKHTIQLNMDILNVGNLINNSWGVRQISTNTGLLQPVGVSVNSQGIPTYSFDTNQTKTFQNDFSLASRWQMQFGIRYIFD
ncbi:MAG: TonB-dependent receptor [Chitinophagaceae bacterium]|nr:TonB-dependent receptor [Chitinophagaceae bacterium]